MTKRKRNDYEVDDDGDNPEYDKLLSQAVTKGDYLDVQEWLARGANVNALAKNFLGSPLYLACIHGHLKIFKLLIEHGADPFSLERDANLNAIVTINCHEGTPMHLASRSGHLEIIKLLLEHGADLNVKDNYGSTPLHEAVRKHDPNLDVVQWLMENGADAHIKDNYGETAFQSACKLGRFELVKSLIDNGAFAVEDNTEWHPLHFACRHNFPVKITKLMIANGASDFINTKEYFETPLHIACDKRNFELAKLLLKNGASTNAFEIGGKTPMHLVCGNSQLTFWWQNQLKLLKLLIAKGADINAKDNHGTTPLHLACGLEFPPSFEKARGREPSKIVNYLIENGADVNAQNSNGNTPLHLACENGHLDVVKLLFPRVANLGVKSTQGITPLHLASKGNHSEVVWFLVRQCPWMVSE